MTSAVMGVCVVSGGQFEYPAGGVPEDREAGPQEPARFSLRALLDRRLERGQIDPERHARLIREAEELGSFLFERRRRKSLKTI